MSSAAALPRVAVVGVSSLIGEAVIDELKRENSRSPNCMRSTMYAAPAGPVPEDDTLTVGDVAAFDFARVNLVFFCGRAALSERYAEAAAAHAWVIDGSAAFRMRAQIPLVVADVNAAVLEAVGPKGLIALAGERERGAGDRAGAAAPAGRS